MDPIDFLGKTGPTLPLIGMSSLVGFGAGMRIEMGKGNLLIPLGTARQRLAFDLSHQQHFKRVSAVECFACSDLLIWPSFPDFCACIIDNRLCSKIVYVFICFYDRESARGLLF